MPHSKYSLHWRKRALAGKGVEPKVLTDASAVLRQISGDKGAVGYVLQSEYDAHGGSGVKIVLTVP